MAISELNLQEGKALEVEVSKTETPRCPRCWRHRSDVGRKHDELCDRCAEALEGRA